MTDFIRFFSLGTLVSVLVIAVCALVGFAPLPRQQFHDTLMLKKVKAICSTWNNCSAMAFKYWKDGKDATAKTYLDKAIALAKREGKLDEVARAIGNKASMHAIKGEIDAAEKYMKLSVDFIKNHNLDEVELGFTIFKLGEALFRSGKEEEGLKIANTGYENYKISGKKFFIRHILEELSFYNLILNNLDKSKYYYKKLLALQDTEQNKLEKLFFRFNYEIATGNKDATRALITEVRSHMRGEFTDMRLIAYHMLIGDAEEAHKLYLHAITGPYEKYRHWWWWSQEILPYCQMLLKAGLHKQAELVVAASPFPVLKLHCRPN